MKTFEYTASIKVLEGDEHESIEVSVWNVEAQKEEFVLVLSVSELQIVEKAVRDILRYMGHEEYNLSKV